MRFVRYSFESEKPLYGWILDDKVGPISGELFGAFRRLPAELPLDRARLYAPVEPSKIIGVGRNYVEHAREQNADVPEIPLIFLKPPSSIIGNQDVVFLPPQSKQVEHEAELAIVIGKRCRWVSAEDAKNYIFGYTVANDITARDLQRRDGQWTRGKGFDTFCPLGPWIETELDAADALITCRVNDELRQMTSTREMVFTIGQLISFISSAMTLEAGDVILTGTPSGVGQLSDGDQLVTAIEGIGSLINPIKAH